MCMCIQKIEYFYKRFTNLSVFFTSEYTYSLMCYFNNTFSESKFSDSNFLSFKLLKLCVGLGIIAEEGITSQYESEVVNDIKETVSFQHNSATAHMNSAILISGIIDSEGKVS